MEIREDDLTGSDIIRLLSSHLESMKGITPEGSVHALDIDKLRAPEISVWSAWDNGALLGCGALKALDSRSGEIKAMRTADAHRRKGVGAKILEQIISEAKRRNYARLYLETGSSAPFAPARALYSRYGFESRGPFGDYVDDPNSVFMVREL